jgi:tRNA pseudouridine38-40 synthase
MLVAYDGSAFHGFAENVGVATVAGTLRAGLERVLGVPIEVAAAGRTDTGVHAWGQVVTFDAPADRIDPLDLRKRLNALCAPAIVVRQLELAAVDFHARFSARWRRYRYTILNRDVPDPFRATTSWHVGAPLDLPAMRLAADPLVGEHDFSSFCRRPRVGEHEEPPSMVRRILSAGWEGPVDDVLTFDVTATSFCHQMVRSVVGTLVEVGLGRKRAGDMLAIIRSKDRHRAGQLAPPHGLCLWEVGYSGEGGPSPEPPPASGEGGSAPEPPPDQRS